MIKLTRVLMIPILSVLLSSCIVGEIIHHQTSYDSDISNDPSYSHIIGKCYCITKDIYLFSISSQHTLARSPSYEIIFQENGTMKEIPCSGELLLAKIGAGSKVKVTGLQSRVSVLSDRTDRKQIRYVLMELKAADGEYLDRNVNGKCLFDYPINCLIPDPEYITEISPHEY